MAVELSILNNGNIKFNLIILYKIIDLHVV